jgi:hypothetical protein
MNMQEGRTALFDAVASNDALKTMALLLDCGASIDAEDKVNGYGHTFSWMVLYGMHTLLHTLADAAIQKYNTIETHEAQCIKKA